MDSSQETGHLETYNCVGNSSCQLQRRAISSQTRRVRLKIAANTSSIL